MTSADGTRTVSSALPIDLSQTLAELRMGVNDPTMLIAGRHLWRASHTPDGPVLFHARALSPTEFDTRAWGPGSGWMLEHAPGFLGATDDLTGFDPELHPKVARAHRRLPGVRIARSGRVGDMLVQTILGQKVTGIQAKKAWSGLVRTHGHPAPGPADEVIGIRGRRSALRLPPTMQEIGQLPYWAFHPLGVEQRRAEVIIRSARRIDRLEEAIGMERADAHRRLTALPGLGEWTAGVLRRLCLGDPDAVEVGDYHIPDVVSFTLAGEPRGTDERMLELLEPFRGHRGRALRLILLGGSGKPSYGPRMTVHAVEDL